MKETRLTYFKNNLAKIPPFRNSDFLLRVKNEWTDSTTQKPSGISDSIERGLNQSEQRALKLDAKKTAFVSVERDIAVVIETRKTISTSDLNNYLARVDECLNAATASYHAHYDELTGILNRRGIKHHFDSTFLQKSKHADQSDDLAKEIENNVDIVLFSFDIDLFKSINDTYGHEIGDIVLASFASKLENLTTSLNSEHSAKFVFGRPGGEEFEMIAIGSLSREQRLSIGSRLLEEIRLPFEPAGNGLELSSRQPQPTQLPSSVTASIGVSWCKAPSDQSDLPGILSSLRKEADTAVYRAKADGRDRLRIYEDIRLRHGRVLEYHENSQLVLVDIGSKVGVQVGQDYAVYYPPFIGSEPVRRGGNGAKLLGTYPQTASAKIKIISVDAEVSTAVVTSNEGRPHVPQGSLLSYIYTGSSILASGRISDHHSVIHPMANIFSHIKELKESNCLAGIVSFGGNMRVGETRSRTVVQDEVFSIMHVLLPSSSRIFHDMGCGSFVVLQNNKDNAKNDIASIIRVIRENIERLGMSFQVGIVTPEALPSSVCCDPEAIVFYANSAFFAAHLEEDRTVWFDSHSPVKTINYWRKKSEVGHAMADYQRLRQYGFDQGELDNHLGLAIAEAGARDYFPVAEVAFARATRSEPSSATFKGNLALLQAMHGNFADAYENFLSVKQFVLEQGGVYLLAFARSVLELNDEDGYGIAAEKVALLREASALSEVPMSAPFDGWLREIQEERN